MNFAPYVLTTVLHIMICFLSNIVILFEEYITTSMMDRVGSWGTDLEIFLAAQLLSTDIFVFKDANRCWDKFSGFGFNNRHYVHDLTEKRLYLPLA